MTLAYSMIASRNCPLAKYLSPRSRCWVFLASTDWEHPVMTTKRDRRTAIHARVALHISVSSITRPSSTSVASLRHEKHDVRYEKQYLKDSFSVRAPETLGGYRKDMTKSGGAGEFRRSGTVGRTVRVD